LFFIPEEIEMDISASTVKELREKTGAGILDCKEALAATQGKLDAAIEYLRKKGLADAKKRAGRATSEGLIGSYIHSNGKIGVLVEVNCETDFVARTDEFRDLCKNLAMQVAASSPRFLTAEDIPADVAAKEKEILRAQARESGKPDAVVEKMVEGRFRKFVTEFCLLEQPYVKDPQMTVRQVIESAIARLGENVRVRRFVRFQLGEDIASAS
jgi:elongation factor Ts